MGSGEDDPLVWYVGSGTTNKRYLLADESGSIIAETNNSGGLLTTHKYDPFGEPINTSTSRFRYTGQILLPGTELYHYKARVYHPELGRFLQTDPLGYQDGMNWYAYVGNDPLNGTDPSGEFASFLIGTAIGAVASGIASVIAGDSIEDTLINIGAGLVMGAVTSGASATAAIGSLAARVGVNSIKTVNLVKGTVAGSIGGASGNLVGQGIIAGKDAALGNEVKNFDLKQVGNAGIAGAAGGFVNGAIAGEIVASGLEADAITTTLGATASETASFVTGSALKEKE